MLQHLSRRRIARLAADIDLLDERMVEIVAADAALAHRYRLLMSMPGVGPVLACTLIALLPELGRMSRKQVAALVGVAPYAFESGTLKGRRCIWGGRAHVRQVLYMAAIARVIGILRSKPSTIGDAQDDHHAQRNGSRRRRLGRPSQRSAQRADRTLAVALIDLAESRP